MQSNLPEVDTQDQKALCNMRCRLDHDQVSACEGCNLVISQKTPPFFPLRSLWK